MIELRAVQVPKVRAESSVTGDVEAEEEVAVLDGMPAGSLFEEEEDEEEPA